MKAKLKGTITYTTTVGVICHREKNCVSRSTVYVVACYHTNNKTYLKAQKTFSISVKLRIILIISLAAKEN